MRLIGLKQAIKITMHHMPHKNSIASIILPLRFKRPIARSWWAPVWRGLIVDESAKHYRCIRSAIWLYLYLVVHADRKTGALFRKIGTIAQDMGVEPTTIRRWLAMLARNDYITRSTTGRSVQITIQRWKRLTPHGDH